MAKITISAVVLLGSLVAVVRPPRLGGSVPGDGLPLQAGVWFVTHEGRVLADGDAIHSEDSVSVAYENAGIDTINVMAFAVDAVGGVHWMAPVRRSPGSLDWSIGNLGPAQHPTLIRTVRLDTLPRGPLRMIYLMGEASIGSDRIDAMAPEELTPPVLRERFPDAAVGEVTLVAG